ncbi:MAG: hypothetical protein U0641_00395 [Anaerolineae bacterium]
MDNRTSPGNTPPAGPNGSRTPPQAGTPEATRAAQETVAAAMAAGQASSSQGGTQAAGAVDTAALYDEMTQAAYSRYVQTPQQNLRLVFMLVAIIVILLMLVIVLFVFGQPFRLLPTPIVRDLLVILLAIESIVVLGLVTWLMFQVRSLLLYMNTEVKPVLDNVNVTLTTMKDTTGFLRETAVSPVIKTQSYATGAMETVRALFRIPGGRP